MPLFFIKKIALLLSSLIWLGMTAWPFSHFGDQGSQELDVIAQL
jgi:hypothetical protein